MTLVTSGSKLMAQPLMLKWEYHRWHQEPSVLQGGEDVRVYHTQEYPNGVALFLTSSENDHEMTVGVNLGLNIAVDKFTTKVYGQEGQ